MTTTPPTIDERLRALLDDEGCCCGPRQVDALHAAYALALEDAERAVFEFVSSHDECPSSAFAHDTANVVHALAAEVRRGR
jgi:hypothetical protein